ncbi:hypothetical protein UT300005_21280 [Clostridium sp. CTA-5]
MSYDEFKNNNKIKHGSRHVLLENKYCNIFVMINPGEISISPGYFYAQI